MLELSEVPKHHPDCCLSLSSQLFQTIGQIVQNVAQGSRDGILLMSVGCGTGLFEATLATYLTEHGPTNARVEGVEVLSAQTPYLSNEYLHRVRGTWEIYDHAEKADVLIFVYPRKGELVRQYMEQFHRTASVVLWLGPQADWIEQQKLLENIAIFGPPKVLENVGLVQYELAILFENTIGRLGKAQTAVEAEGELPLWEQTRPI